MRRPSVEPAAVILGGSIAFALGGDAWLIRTGRRPLVTDVARHPVALAFWALFAGHLAGVWGRLDPFHQLGRLAHGRSTP